MAGKQTTYSAFLNAVFEAMRASGRASPEDAYEEVVHQLAAEHLGIGLLPDMPARLEAARRLLFGGTESTKVEITDHGCQVSVYTCPLAPLGMETRDLCAATRAALSRLTGLDVEQSEWIARGDWRCTFEIRSPDGR